MQHICVTQADLSGRDPEAGCHARRQDIPVKDGSHTSS
jgi:hypothetical protein